MAAPHAAERAVLLFRECPATVVVQPTPLCNLRCTYCYLPDLGDARRMPVSLAELVAEQLAALPGGERTDIDVRWHAGEPLTMGVERLAALLEPFEALRRDGRVHHSLQTNATLVTAEWCAFFERYGVDVGVSIDGPRWANRRRRTLSGAESYDRARRGIDRLRDHGIPYSVIAVVSLDDIPRIVAEAADYLGFFGALGARAVGFNVEETEGNHEVPVGSGGDLAVAEFWQAIFAAWQAAGCRPVVRELADVLHFAAASLAGERSTVPVDLIPTVTCDGDVVLLSPELAGYRDPRYGDFVAGNLTRDHLADILDRAPTLRYVEEFRQGTRRCEKKCPYFAYCRGGQASNRLFEYGTFDASETEHCVRTRQLPFDVVVGWKPTAQEPGQLMSR